MDNERFLRAFGEIDDKYLEKADALYNDWRESQKGISVRAERSRRSSRKIAIVSAACTAAVMLGVFALLLNIGKIGFIDISSGSVSSDSTPAQSSAVSELPAAGTTPCAHEYYRLGDNVRVGEAYDTHGYNCTVTYSAYRHTKWCASCGEYLGEGPTFRCTEEHTCGNHIKSCTGAFLNDGAQ